MRWEIARTWDGHPIGADEACTLDVQATDDAIVLIVRAPYHGDPPPTGPAGPRDALWEHEVVEWFVASESGPYLEVELGPHGHHLVLQLDRIRHAVARELPITWDAHIHGDRWHGMARLPRFYLPDGPYRGNAFAIHGVSAARRYLAAEPLPGRAPDFHQPKRFVECDLPTGFPRLPIGATVAVWRGAERLGTIQLTDADQPFWYGTFVAEAPYAPLADRFARESRACEQIDTDYEAWELLAMEINGPGLAIVEPDGWRLEEILLHIDGERAWFRP